MSASSGRGRRLESYGLGAALVAVVVLVLLLRPTGGAGQPGTRAAGTSPGDTSSTGAEPSDAQSPDAPAKATEEDFCAGFVRLAESQAAFAGDGDSGAAELEESVRALVDTGVPNTMSLPARSGYYTVISGVHDALGLDVTPAAVGAPPTQAEGGDAAFAAYLGQHCPA